MRRIVSLVVFVACLIFMGSVVSAKVWLLPDYENNDLFKSRNNTKTRPSDPGRECTGYGWKSLASFPSDLECLEEYNGHIKCCKKWRCDTDIYTYNSDTCSGDIEGNKCYNDDGTEYGTECHILCDREKFPYHTKKSCSGDMIPSGECTDIINDVNSTKHYSACNCNTSIYPYASCTNYKNSTPSEDDCTGDNGTYYKKCICSSEYPVAATSCSTALNESLGICTDSDGKQWGKACVECGDCQRWNGTNCAPKGCETNYASDVSQCPNNNSVSTPYYCKYEIGDKDVCDCAPCNATCADGYMTNSDCTNSADGNRTAIFTQAGTCGSTSCGTCSVDCRDPYHDDSTECGTDISRCKYGITGADSSGCGQCSYDCNNENGYYSSTSGCTGTLQANAEWVLKSTGTCGSTTCGTCAQQCKTNFVDTFSHWCAKPATHNCSILGYSTSVTSCETGTLIKCPFDTSYGVCVGGASGDGGSGGSEDDGCDSSYSLASCPTDQGARSCEECGGKYRILCCKSGYTWASWDTCCNMSENLYHDVVYGWTQTVVGKCYRMESCQHGWMDCYGRSCVQCEDENCGSYNMDNCPDAWNTKYNECAT